MTAGENPVAVERINIYDSRWYSIRNDKMGRFVVRCGAKVDHNGEIRERSDTREFPTYDEALAFAAKFLGY